MNGGYSLIYANRAYFCDFAVVIVVDVYGIITAIIVDPGVLWGAGKFAVIGYLIKSAACLVVEAALSNLGRLVS